jgi:hypothetical protein
MRKRYQSFKPKWQLTVATKDNSRVIFHAQCEDWKELQCLATEARSQSLSYNIYWRAPASEESNTWD